MGTKPFMMTPYTFKPNSAQLVQQPGGQWVAEFEACVYTGQTFSEISNSINPENIRVIEFDVLGDENVPTSYRAGSSAPYMRGAEKEVELVLKKDGNRKDAVRVHYP